MGNAYNSCHYYLIKHDNKPCLSANESGYVQCRYFRYWNEMTRSCAPFVPQQLCDKCYDSLSETDKRKWFTEKEYHTWRDGSLLKL